MKQNIIWVLGHQCSGKTFTLKKLQSSFVDKIECLFIGEALRAVHPIMSFVNSENSYAPPFAEIQVHSMIKISVSDFVNLKDKPLLFIDSAPKTQDQLSVLRDIRDEYPHVGHILLIFNTPEEIRRERAMNKYYGDMKYYESRKPHEDMWLSLVRVELAQDMPIITCNPEYVLNDHIKSLITGM